MPLLSLYCVQEIREGGGRPPSFKWSCFYAEKEHPTNSESSFVMSGHDYKLPSLPLLSSLSAAPDSPQ